MINTMRTFIILFFYSIVFVNCSSKVQNVENKILIAQQIILSDNKMDTIF
jgi:uncharacterized protein YcfL